MTKLQLQQFTGSEVWYRHSLNRDVLYTEGVRYMADIGGAHWLIDEVALVQKDPLFIAQEFQVWKLTVQAGNRALLSCEDGNGKTIKEKQIEFTDFPLDEISLWYSNNVILLPSEY